MGQDATPAHARSTRILFGLVFGLALGLLAGGLIPESSQPQLSWWIDQVVQPAGRVFLRIIFMVVVPLILSAIVLGTMEMGDLRTLGRVGTRTLLLTLLLSTLSVGIALALVNTLSPGTAMPESSR